MREISPALVIGVAGAFTAAVVGAFTGRADLVLLALPLAGWGALVWLRREAATPEVSVTAAEGEEPDVVATTMRARTDAELAQLSIVTIGNVRFDLVVPGAGGEAVVTSRIFHSGPMILGDVVARGLSVDGAVATPVAERRATTWNAAPIAAAVRSLPTARRLPGMHGTHAGARLGDGGEFRDLHPFAPGDSLRRIDWRATARRGTLAGEVFVRRTHTLSDSAVAVIVDTADDLSGNVALWSSTDVERTGETSLDRARAGARSFAEAAIAAGDRVSYRALAMHGEAVRAGTGRRHLARVVAAIAATGPRHDEDRFERTPAVPPAATVVLLSTFFDGDASRLALVWAAGGHRVLAVDVLPPADTRRLTEPQRFAADVVFAERRTVMRRLTSAGVELISWTADGLDLAPLARRGHR